MKKLVKTKVLIAGFTGMIFFGVAFVILGAVMPSLLEKFSIDHTQASMLAGLLPVGILLGSLLFGPVIDRFGYKSLIIVASLTTFVGLQWLALSETITSARISIFLIGLGGGVLNGLTNSLVSDISTDRERASNLSILGVFYTAGALTIPLLFATLSGRFTYTAITSGAGFLVLLSALYYIFINFPQAKHKQGLPLIKMLSVAKEPFVLLLSFILFFQSGIEGISNNWIPEYLKSYKEFGNENSMLALTALIAGVGIGRALLGFILRRTQGGVVLSVSMIMVISGATLLEFTSSNLMVFSGISLIGIGFASTFPIVFSMLGTKYREISGTVFSFALVIALTGNTLLNILIGQIGLNRYPTLIALCAITIITLFTINNLLNKRKKSC